jgi:pimeloyl-ACP methyl ester carboxylesterase
MAAGVGPTAGARPPRAAIKRLRRRARRVKQTVRRTRKNLLEGGFRRSLEDPDVPLSIDMDSDSRTLLVAFGGMHRDMGMPPFEFFAVTREIPSKRLFVRDLRRAWYHKGIEGHGETITAAADSLKELIAQHEVDRLITVGSSAGGYAALVFGALLGADKALSFGPQTVIDPATIAAIGDHRWDGELAELQAAGVLDANWTDLRYALPRARSGETAETSYEIYFSHNNTRPNTGPGRDRAHAERLRGVEGVRLYRFGHGGHMIARSLRENGALDKILRRALLATPQ